MNHDARLQPRGPRTAQVAAESTDARPRIGVVVLTQGRRPTDLARGLESVLGQRGVQLDVVVVGNGWDPVGLPAGVRGHGLPENLGIPAGRNAGVPLVSGDLLFFLDDDASLPTQDVLATIAARFASDSALGLLQPRVVDADGRPAPRRWTPRVWVGNPGRSSAAMNVWEGAVAIRREAFDYSGGWPEPFWYAHEGIELAWRVWDGGFHVRYDGRIEVCHPAVAPTRHAEFFRFQARNRVWLARRNLPVPIGVVYVVSWAVVAGVRLRSRVALVETLRGYQLGLTLPCGERRPLRWRTVARMLRAGHPPII
jgi:GT2 family glycosyltransferase